MIPSNSVITRFAPSPTGHLHIGSVRTAYYAWLLAKHYGGSFVLRIEDTDLARSDAQYTQGILEALQWLGLQWDEGPYLQTDRLDRYREVARSLAEKGILYACHCSSERLQQCRDQQMANKQKPKYDRHCLNHSVDLSKPHVWRFRMPESGTIQWHDVVYGSIQMACHELDDWVVMRSDGTPTYNFTVAVDDYDMRISHVIRGDDHISNTPKQILLMQSAMWSIPVYAHIPMILGEDKKKLSKRHAAIHALAYREEGYLPSAILNHLARLGWSHGDQEILSIEETIRYFDLTHIQKSPAVFSTSKLNWLNQHYLLSATASDIEKNIIPYLNDFAPKLLSAIVDIPHWISVWGKRFKTLKECVEQSHYLYTPIHPSSDDAMKIDDTHLACRHLAQTLETIDWEVSSIQQAIHSVMDQKPVHHWSKMLRLQLTGHSHTPPLPDVIYAMGRKRAVNRLCFLWDH